MAALNLTLFRAVTHVALLWGTPTSPSSTSWGGFKDKTGIALEIISKLCKNKASGGRGVPYGNVERLI
jgi:hypothetical protein